MKSITKLYLLAAGTVIYAAGYLVLLAAVLQGQVSGLSGIAAVIMATGLLIAMVFGVALAKTEAEIMGQL